MSEYALLDILVEIKLNNLLDLHKVIIIAILIAKQYSTINALQTVHVCFRNRTA